MFTSFWNWLKAFFGDPIPTQEETPKDLKARENDAAKILWESLVNEKTCPICQKQGDLYLYARGGMAENWICNNCNTRYWLSPIQEMGAKIIS